MTEEKKQQSLGERKEVYVDFEGNAGQPSTKVLIQEDSYMGEVSHVDLVELPVYNKPDQTQFKVIIQVKLVEGENQGVVLPLYANPVIKKSSGTKGYSNSKLYDLLVSSGLLERAKEQHDALETYEGLAGFLDAGLKGKECKVLVGTVNKGTDNAYSVVRSVLRFDISDQGVVD